MTEPQALSALRAKGWSEVPSSPGVYWWYFPQVELGRLRVADFCDVPGLQLRLAPDGKVCLYHGMANNLAERVEWHAAQKLTLKCLQSGFLSTFRFTLLALNDFDYLGGSVQIDDFFDRLSIGWQVANTRAEAEAVERRELMGTYHFPLNIQGNSRPELSTFVRHLKSTRSAYKRRFVNSGSCLGAKPIVMQPKRPTVYLVSCVSKKREQACAARDLYVSDLFRKARRFAEMSRCQWFILSAEHGLVAPEQVISPYERTLNTMPSADRRSWGERVAAQLAEAVPNLSRVVFLAGKRYREYLDPHLASRGVEVSVPMKGLRIGEQLSWLGQHSPQSVVQSRRRSSHSTE